MTQSGVVSPESPAPARLLAPPDEHSSALGPRVGEYVADVFERFRRRHGERECPIPLPWPTVGDALGGGLWPGLHVLVGNTGSGKSTWALQAALHAACAGIPVLYVGLELDRDQLVARLLGTLSNRYWSGIYQGRDPELETLLRDHAGVLKDLPLHLEEAPPMGWSASELETAAAELRRRYPRQAAPSIHTPEYPPLLVVDFLQLVGPPPDAPTLSVRERIQQAAYRGRAVAREHDIAVLLVSSTQRDSYATLDNGPFGKDGCKLPASSFVGKGKESGEIEYAADSVMTLVREPWPKAVGKNDPQMPAEGTHTHLAVAKLRAGQESWVELRFNGRSFSEPTPGGQVLLGNVTDSRIDF